MQINHNISALIANGHLKTTNRALDKSIERLSSGYRINHAADDAAGMAISQKMKTQIAGLEQASRNASDGISVIQTAEGALNEVQAILQRSRELAVQAANGTNTPEDREAIQKEIDQLMEEIDRISTDTEFNTKALLDGNLDRKTYSSSTSVSLISISDAVDCDTYELTVEEVGISANITGGAMTLTDIVKEEAGTVIINGETVDISEGDTNDEVIDKIRTVCDRCNITMDTEGDVLSFKTKEAGADQSISIYCENGLLAKKLGLDVMTTTLADGTVEAVDSTDPTVKGTDAKVVLKTEENDGKFSNTCTVIADGNIVKITDSDGFEMKFEIDEYMFVDEDGNEKVDAAGNPISGEVNISVLDAGPMLLQIGANEGQTVEVAIPEVSTRTLGLEHLNLLTETLASEGITMLDEAINIVSSVRSKLGAYQNRLEHAVANLDTSAENLTEALSRIEDVDMAEEMANYTQKNVLAQAGVSMVSQANERPQTILSLLQ